MTAPTQPARRLSATEIAAILALIEAQARVRAQLTRAAVEGALAPFRLFTGWWDTDRVTRAIVQALRVVQPAQRNAARITDAYLARVATALTGRPVRPAGNVDITRLRRAIPERVWRQLEADQVDPVWIELGDSVDGPGPDINRPWRPAVHGTRTAADPPDEREWANPGDPYGRAADQYRYDVVVRGKSEAEARAKALVRIEVAAETDVTLAVREQYLRTLTRIPGITGYRRILHPELSETGPCGLCVVAADRVYSKEDLHPLHDRCKCEVLPIIGSLDPGLELNRDELDALYAAAAEEEARVARARGRAPSISTGRQALKRIRVALAEHGELGPVLVDARQNYRGPRQVARTRRELPDANARRRAELASLEDKFAQLLRRSAAGEDVERPLEYQAGRIEQLRRELGVAA